jgi:hypothetical protein
MTIPEKDLQKLHYAARLEVDELCLVAVKTQGYM